MRKQNRNRLVGLLGICALSACQTSFLSSPAYAADKAEYLFGFIDKTGKVVVAPEYEEARPFSEGLALVQKKVDDNYRYGYIDHEGKTGVEFKYAEAGPFSEGLAPVRVPDSGTLVDELGSAAAGKWGFIDKTGDFVIAPRFEEARSFSDGLAAVAEENRYGYVDKTGNFVIKPKFDLACPFVNGRAAIMTNDGTGMLSIQSGGDIYRVSGGKWSYINKNGEVEFGPFEACGVFNDGMSPVALGPNQGKFLPNKWGFVDTNGKFVIKPNFNNVHALSEGKAAVQTGTWKNMGLGIKSWIPGKWGYINSKGKQIIESKFDGADPFSDGMASVMIDHKWGYIDTAGNMVIQPQYRASWGFSENLAPVQISVEPKSETQSEQKTEPVAEAEDSE